jgi:hypothetical protein
MSFRTLGYFGPECPTPPQFPFEGQFNKMRLVPQAQASGYDFPLELAMKIFWESATLQITGSVTTDINGTFTSTVDETFSWGSYRDDTFPANARDTITRAKDLLCLKKSTPLTALHGNLTFGSHTIFRKNITRSRPSGGTWNTVIFGFIREVPYLDSFVAQTRIYAPFQCFIENSGLTGAPNGIYLDPFAPRATAPFTGGSPTLEGPTASITTPWGNFSAPTRIGQAVTSSSLSITVTAADTSVRYA